MSIPTSSPVTNGPSSSGSEVTSDHSSAVPTSQQDASTEDSTTPDSIPEQPEADATEVRSASETAFESEEPIPEPNPEISTLQNAPGPEECLTVDVKTPEKPIGPSSQSSVPSEFIYHAKWIRYRGKSIPIITQNENGPCPLIAISNVLLLKSIISLPEKTEVVTGERLVSRLTDVLLSHPVQDLDKGQLLNYETTVSDALNLFPSLQTGLDVNVRFTGVSAFEFTSVLGVFDLFGISLYHGWLVDPRDLELASIVGDRTYNRLVEEIIHLKASSDPDDVRKGLLADDFLQQTASQLTYHGLDELVDALGEGQLAVLFRNNHFCTITKNKGQIYVLVTDMGLLDEPNVVWEALCDVDGNTRFADATFAPYTPSATDMVTENSLFNESAAVSPSAANAVAAASPSSSSSSSSQSSSAASSPPRTTDKVLARPATATSLNTASLPRSTTVLKTTISRDSLHGEGKASKQFDRELSPESKWESNLSLTELACQCTKLLSSNPESDPSLSCDANMAARLQLEEIESSQSGVRIIAVRKPEPGPKSITQSPPLSMDDLKEICPQEVLEQAMAELNTGSDLDLALRLQFEEMQQARHGGAVRAPTASHTAAAVGRGQASRPSNSSSSQTRGRFQSKSSSSSVTVTSNRPNDEDKSSCALM